MPGGPASSSPVFAAVGLDPSSGLGAWLTSEGGRLLRSVSELHADEEPISCVLLTGRWLDVLSDLLTLKDERTLSRLPVLTILNAGQHEHVAACVRAGAFYCFVQPVDRSLLSAMLRAAVAVGGIARIEPEPTLEAWARSLSQVKEIALSLRSIADVERVSAFIAELCPQPARQALGISELLLNAIEHGSLEISGAEKAELVRSGKLQSELMLRANDPRFAQREVTLWLRRSIDHVEIVCEDQGPGFDWKALDDRSPGAPNAPNGRGIALTRQLAFDSLEFLGRGNVAVARARLDRRTRHSAAHAFSSLSGWERRALDLEADRVLENATSSSFFSDALALALRVSDSPVGLVGYLTESGDLLIPAHTVEHGPEARSGESTLRLSSASWARIWWEALDQRQTRLQNQTHPLFRGSKPLERSLVVPIAHHGELLGMIHVAERDTDYGERDAQRLVAIGQRLAPTLSAWISAGLATSRQQELERERARQREEQELARHIVSRLLREGCLDGQGIRYHVAATAFFNGDLALAARLPGGGLRWMLGDCVGHGLPAAIGGLPLSSVFYATAAKGVPLSEVVVTMNDTLLELLPRGFFCAAVLLELSANGERVTIWNGGLPPAFVCSNRKPLQQVHSNNLPFGTVRSSELDASGTTIALDADDRILCFSDGLIETHSFSGELFGLERAAAIAASTPSDQVFAALLQALADFRGDNPSFDDVSLVAVSPSAATG